MDGVVPQIVVPSVSDAMDVGEKFLDHALEHDRIRPAANLKPLEEKNLFIPRLLELSVERRKENKDFVYTVEDVFRAKKRIDANAISLNKLSREKELAESDAMQKERNAERRVRFEKMQELDKKELTFYKLTLEDLEKGADLKPHNPSDESGSYMRRAKDETADLDETPKWPTGLDPLKREALAVLKDLVDLTENAALAGMLKGSSENH